MIFKEQKNKPAPIKKDWKANKNKQYKTEKGSNEPIVRADPKAEWEDICIAVIK